MSELKPCPFCGSEAEESTDDLLASFGTPYGCGECGIWVSQISTWNTRASTDETARADELRQLLKECRKVMKADNLHRGNPDRRGLWNRITKALEQKP